MLMMTLLMLLLLPMVVVVVVEGSWSPALRTLPSSTKPATGRPRRRR
jgi:hypothetical protein